MLECELYIIERVRYQTVKMYKITNSKIKNYSTIKTCSHQNIIPHTKMFFKAVMEVIDELEREYDMLNQHIFTLNQELVALNVLLNSSGRSMYMCDRAGRKYSMLEKHRSMICRDIGWLNQRLNVVIKDIDEYTSIKYYEGYSTLYHEVTAFSFDQEVLDRARLEQESEALGDRVTMLGQDLDQYKFDGSNVELEDGETRVTLMDIKDSLLMQRRRSAIKKDV